MTASTNPRNLTRAAAIAVAVTGLVAIAAPLAGASPPPPPQMPPANQFVARVSNPYLPLKPGTTLHYAGRSDDGRVRDRFTVTRRTKTIAGVDATVVRDVGRIGGRYEEKTFDWFAQDSDGNVWYLGERSYDRKNGRWVRNDGSWKTGVDGASAGIAMEADPRVGDRYRQEYYAGHAEDIGEVLSLDERVTVPFGTFGHTLETRDTSLLERGIVEHKFFARSVGEVRSEMVRGGHETTELVAVTRG